MIELFTFWIAVCYFTMFINKQVYVILCSSTSGTRATKAYLHENGWHSKIWDLYIFSRDDKFCFSNYMPNWWCYQSRKSSANLTLKIPPPPSKKSTKNNKNKKQKPMSMMNCIALVIGPSPMVLTSISVLYKYNVTRIIDIFHRVQNNKIKKWLKWSDIS